MRILDGMSLRNFLQDQTDQKLLFFLPSGKCKIQFYLSPKRQVSEEGDSQEDGRDSTADVGDKGEDGGVETAGYGLPGEVLWTRKKISQSVGLKNTIIDDNYTWNSLKALQILTSRIAKLVKWLQLQTVSLSVLLLA